MTLILLALAGLALAQDTFCGITVGTPMTAAMGAPTEEGNVSTPYRLATVMGQRVVSVCKGRVFSVTWNNIFQNPSVIPGIPPITDVDGDMVELFAALLGAGWVTIGDVEYVTNGTKTRWIKGTEERILALTTTPLEGVSIVRLSLVTTYTVPCDTGI
jgi:hypothetical protein